MTGVQTCALPIFQNAFKDYFTGNVEEDAAKANFETAIKEKYPELTEVVWPA